MLHCHGGQETCSVDVDFKLKTILGSFDCSFRTELGFLDAVDGNPYVYEERSRIRYKKCMYSIYRYPQDSMLPFRICLYRTHYFRQCRTLPCGYCVCCLANYPISSPTADTFRMAWLARCSTPSDIGDQPLHWSHWAT